MFAAPNLKSQIRPVVPLIMLLVTSWHQPVSYTMFQNFIWFILPVYMLWLFKCDWYTYNWIPFFTSLNTWNDIWSVLVLVLWSIAWLLCRLTHRINLCICAYNINQSSTQIKHQQLISFEIDTKIIWSSIHCHARYITTSTALTIAYKVT